MPARLFANSLAFTAIGGTAGTPPANYPASNIESPRIQRPYFGDAGANQFVSLDLGADTDVAAIFLNAINITNIDIHTEPDAGGGYTTAGTLLRRDDPTGRRKGWLEIDRSNVRYVYLDWDAQTPDSGQYAKIGAAWIFGTEVALTSNFRHGLRRREVVPQQVRVLPNGRIARVHTGAAYAVIEGEVHDIDAEGRDMSDIWVSAVRTNCGLVLGQYDHDFWPVTLDGDEEYSSTYEEAGVRSVSIRLREVA